MLLKSLTLKNIRSYIDQHIEFPDGSLLLAGDIGSGKSTILLAIEFALFGLLRGDVDGAALLRNGSREGFVELTFSLEGKEYSIRRALKRQKDRVSQDAGWLETAGVRKDGTSQELKAWIIDILGYPKEFLSKSKALLFRYTVFTPQEEMKRILFEDKDARLETLRRVFDVDKYKRIKENATIYVRELKEERRHLEGFTQDLESKKKLLALKQEEAQSAKARSETVRKDLDLAKQRTAAQRQSVQQKENAVKDVQRLRQELQVAKTSLAHYEQTVQRAERDLLGIKAQLELMRDDLQKQTVPLEETRHALGQKQLQVTDLERCVRESHVAVAQLQTQKKFSDDIKQKVATMNNCPTCLQVVTLDHKNRIEHAENLKLHQIEDYLRRHAAAREQFETQLVVLKQEFDALRRQESETLLLNAKRSAAQDRQASLATLEQTRQQAVVQAEVLRTKVAEVAALVDAHAGAEDDVKDARLGFERLLSDERRLDVDHQRLLKEIEGIEVFANSVQGEIALKEQAKLKLQRTMAVQAWLTDHFSNLMDVMEKHVLSRVHHEFNDLFQRWFGILIEDELLTARLDDTFTPVITQNGYDVDVANLSGGEKTACALAYRLALNKVINDVINTIKTKDLLILDEPTDGFSAEQLDKVRDVLEQLRLKQVIIVSHESKIESMVDSVLRVQKDGHISNIIAT